MYKSKSLLFIELFFLNGKLPIEKNHSQIPIKRIYPTNLCVSQSRATEEREKKKRERQDSKGREYACLGIKGSIGKSGTQSSLSFPLINLSSITQWPRREALRLKGGRLTVSSFFFFPLCADHRRDFLSTDLARERTRIEERISSRKEFVSLEKAQLFEILHRFFKKDQLF